MCPYATVPQEDEIKNVGRSAVDARVETHQLDSGHARLSRPRLARSAQPAARCLEEQTPGKNELLAASELEPNLDERVHGTRANEAAPEQIETGVGVRGVPTR